MTVSLKKYDPINPLEDRPHRTVTSGTLTCFSFSSSMCGVLLAQYTQLCWLIMPLSLNVASSSWKSSLHQTCAETFHKITVFMGCSHLLLGQVWNASIFGLAEFSEQFLISILLEHCLTDFFGDHAKTWLHQHSP